MEEMGIAKRGPKKNKYFVFVDFQKAFNSGDRNFY
jgi:hypothetical protein